jgi:hypothetical protein
MACNMHHASQHSLELPLPPHDQLHCLQPLLTPWTSAAASGNPPFLPKPHPSPAQLSAALFEVTDLSPDVTSWLLVTALRWSTVWCLEGTPCWQEAGRRLVGAALVTPGDTCLRMMTGLLQALASGGWLLPGPLCV